MLKIWLTCLQPSLGILGVVLVLSNAVSAHAGAKTTGIVPNKLSKGQSQQKTVKPLAQPQQFGTQATGLVTASTPKVASFSASVTPDDAVRQLAIDTIANSQRKTSNLAAKASPQNSSGIASFVSPSPVVVSSTTPKSTNVKFARRSFTAETPLSPGLFTGNSSSTFDRPIENFPNLAIPSNQAFLPVVAQPIPTVPMTTSAKVAEPSLVMVSEQIKPVGSVDTVVAQTARQSNPSATTVAKGLEQFLGNEPQNVSMARAPETTVAKGLEQFLGNEPKSIQADSMAPVAQATPVNVDSPSALSELVTPTKAAVRNTNGSSLQLATSGAYDSAAEFDLPGVASQLQAVKTAQSKVKVLAVKSVKTDLSTATVQPKNDFAALISDKNLKPQPLQPWTTMSQRNSLGGLILGSRSSIDDAQASTNEIASLPMNVLKANIDNGLGLFDPTNQY
jgi:hypothetical protein